MKQRDLEREENKLKIKYVYIFVSDFIHHVFIYFYAKLI